MRAREISQEELGVAIGRGQKYIGTRTRGETSFSVDDLERIAEYLGIESVSEWLEHAYEQNADYLISQDLRGDATDTP